VFASVENLADGLHDAQYVVDRVTLQVVYLAAKICSSLLANAMRAKKSAARRTVHC
jgi:hypothetical protein